MNEVRLPMYYSNEELIRMVDNKQDATPLERELANRLDAALQGVINDDNR